ncbi:MAG: hydrogenase subunit MbhD domain-containing protein [Chloroflexota bacterium]
MTAAQLALAVALLAAAITAVRAKSLIITAIAIAVGNSSLALWFFLLRAPYAGSVQLSVGAGVVSALFLIAISLTEPVRGGPRED